MRKILYTLLALVAYGGSVCAQSLTVDPDPVEVIQGGTGEIVLKVDPGTTETGIRACQFDIKLPVGITLVEDGYSVGPTLNNFSITVTPVTGTDPSDPTFDGTRWRVQINTQQQNNYMTDVIAKIKVAADPSLAIDTELPAQLVGAFGNNANTHVHLTGQDGSYNLDDINFTIKIVGLVLDENQTDIPDLSDFIGKEVNVKVKRSITGGNWSTICLPFAMTEDQIEDAFGEGTHVYEFTGCIVDYNKQDDSKIDIIHVKFGSTTEMAANHPYLIKTANTITYADGFNVNGVNFEGFDEAAARLDLDETVVIIKGKKYYYYNSFIGQYTATTTLGEESDNGSGVLFIANNMFYRATGSSTMKAFRGYFDLQDLYTYLESNSSANISLFIDGEATDINEISSATQIVEGVYDLQGRKMNGDLNTLQKGIYIVNGKKVTVK